MNSLLIARSHRVAVGLIQRTLLLDPHQLHVDLLGQDVDRISSKPCHNHGPQVGDVRTLTEGRDPPSHAISGLQDDHLEPEGVELLGRCQTSDPGADDDDGAILLLRQRLRWCRGEERL